MKIARGPRPWPIHAFAALFGFQALWSFGFTLADLDGQLAYLSARYPDLGFSRDSMIVIASARLTIAAIPLALVWLFAKGFARWFCTILAGMRLVQLPAFVTQLVDAGTLDFVWLVSTLLTFVAVGLLFTPEAGAWFGRRKTDVETFA